MRKVWYHQIWIQNYVLGFHSAHPNVVIYIYVHTYTNRSVPYFTFFFGLQNSFTFVLRIFLLLLKICIKLIRITFIHKVLGKVQIIPRYLTVQWWAQAGIFWDEMNWKISKNVLNWPYIVISTKYLLFCYYYSMYIEKEYVTIPLLLLILSCLLFMFFIQKCEVKKNWLLSQY